MSNQTLKDRIESYYELSNYKLLPKTPIIAIINGRSFSKNTSLLDKPFCDKFSECIISTMMRLCTDVDGVVFGYQFNDEIVLVIRNDQNNDTLAWYDNKIQKINSVISSIATAHFSKCAKSIDLSLMGDSIFYSHVFVVPTISEAINTLIYKQQHNFNTSIQFACFYELLNKFDKKQIKDILSGKSYHEKINLLHSECGVDFNKYPQEFKLGVGCYKVQKYISEDLIKNKWEIDKNLPIFSSNQHFLTNIFKFGADIFK